mmetsp:Transcript_726/g.1746  ORF Transcript_726/g.1746 Transcript_726/m.1746 type:complete len:205 (+) Transcript_726:2999-3613(+)
MGSGNGDLAEDDVSSSSDSPCVRGCGWEHTDSLLFRTCNRFLDSLFSSPLPDESLFRSLSGGSEVSRSRAFRVGFGFGCPCDMCSCWWHGEGASSRSFVVVRCSRSSDAGVSVSVGMCCCWRCERFWLSFESTAVVVVVVTVPVPVPVRRTESEWYGDFPLSSLLLLPKPMPRYRIANNSGIFATPVSQLVSSISYSNQRSNKD